MKIVLCYNVKTLKIKGNGKKMIKKEINEIKSLFDTIQDCGISRLAGCYVNGDKTKVKTFNDSFLNLPEEEMYKYLEIHRRYRDG